ncbi:MAG TPA: hypothetical protein VH370_22510 [Humisphaera sp.]|jgi:hydroxylaminobenzene mutase|nr:hypothetical protein [Humisphaera sp.]
MLVGLVWGLIVPHTPYPRLALGAHIQLTGSGIMFLVAGLVIAHLNLGTGQFSRVILLAGPWITWPMALSEIANAWWGTSKMLPIVAHQGGAAGAAPWQEAIVAITHVVAGLFIIVYWATVLWGLQCRSKAT